MIYPSQMARVVQCHLHHLYHLPRPPLVRDQVNLVLFEASSLFFLKRIHDFGPPRKQLACNMI